MKSLLIACIVLSYVFLISCRNEVSNDASIESIDENIRLKQQLLDEQSFVEILNDQMSVVNQLLDSIGIIHNLQSDSDTISLDEKIILMDNFLSQSENKILELEQTVYNLKDDKQVNLLNSIIRNLKKELTNNNIIIQELKIENDSINNINIGLNENLIQSTEDNTKLVKSINDQLAKFEVYRKMAEDERKSFSEQKNKLLKELESTKYKIDEERANAYFDLAVDLKDQYDDTGNGFLGSKKSLKNDILLKSYNYFREACKFGHPDASRYIKEYFSNEKYYKNLKIVKTNQTSIGRCGI